jgi:hypothetical protein
MKKLGSLLQQDFKLLLHNAIFWVISVTLVLIIVTVNFLVPSETSVNQTQMVVYGLDIEGSWIEHVDTLEEVERAVRETAKVGVVGEEDPIKIIHDGLSDKAVALLATTLTPPSKIPPQVKVVSIGKAWSIAPLNKRMMPILISFEAVVLGFVMAGVLLLEDKQEMVLQAYRVSPGGTASYIVSKTLLFALVGTVYAILMAVLTIGVSFNWGTFLLLTFLGCALYTLLGLCVTVFFKDLSSWFFVATLVLSLNMLPMITYSAPTFSPTWIRYVPSYPIVFSYGHVLFQTGKGISHTIALLAGEVVITAIVCSRITKKKLLSAN